MSVFVLYVACEAVFHSVGVFFTSVLHVVLQPLARAALSKVFSEMSGGFSEWVSLDFFQ